MLRKLLKYEFKAASRNFLPIYGALILVALVDRLFRMRNINLGYDLTTLILVGLFIALGVLTLIVTIQRFSKNLLGDEGYLMFTLPVKSRQLISSKLIATVVWGILSGIVGLITCLVLAVDYAALNELINSWPKIWGELVRAIRIEFNGQVTFALLGIPTAGILAYIEGILVIYLALATAQLPIFSKYRSVISFVAFFVINTVLQLLLQVVGIIIPLGAMTGTTRLLVVLIGFLLVDTILFMGVNYIVSKHLNLE